jgi:hypothetical protein
MKISVVNPPRYALGRTRLVSSKQKAWHEVSVSRAPAEMLEAAPTTLQEGHLQQIITAGVKAKAADVGATLLIHQINRATPAEIRSVLLDYNLSGSASDAQTKAWRLINAVHSNIGGSILLGVRGGVATFVVVDTLAPKWPLGRKIGMAVAAAVMIATGAFIFATAKPATGEGGAVASASGAAVGHP